MKRSFWGFAILCLFLMLAAGLQAADWWIIGTVKGEKIKHKKIAVHLVKIDDPTERSIRRTVTNKKGQYAFSDPGEGLAPDAYKVVLEMTPDLAIDVSLENVKPRGRQPAVIPPVTVYW